MEKVEYAGWKNNVLLTNGTVELVEAAWWHPLHATDPALTWLRGIILGSLDSLARGRGELAPDSLDEQAHLVCDEA